MLSRGWPCCWAMRMSELMNAAQVALNCTGDGRRQRDVGDVRHRDAEIALRALFEKGAGAGGAGVVHRVVNGHAIAQVDVFGSPGRRSRKWCPRPASKWVAPAAWAEISLYTCSVPR